MKILALYGSANRGKTNSIIQIYSDLLNFGATQIWYQATNNFDFLAILEYQNKIITINSAGDSETEVVKDGLSQIENELRNRNLKMDCHICATRTKGSSVTALQNYFNSTKPIWFDSLNLINSTQNILNLYYNFQSQRIIPHI